MRTLALRVLIGSIALSALTGIYVLIVGGDGDLEGKVLATSLSISALSILAMACGAGLEGRKLGLLPHAGIAAAVAGFVLLMIVIWDLGSHRVWVQLCVSMALGSTAAALACLLSLVALAPRFRWVRALGFVADAALTTMLNLFVWELLDTPNDVLARLTGVFAILLGAVIIAMPILQRMGKPEERRLAGANAGTAESVRHCVVCGERLKGAQQAEFTCSGCGARFRVEFPEKRN